MDQGTESQPPDSVPSPPHQPLPETTPAPSSTTPPPPVSQPATSGPPIDAVVEPRAAGLNFNIGVPIIDRLLKWLAQVLQERNVDPFLAVPILVDVAVLVIGIIILVVLEPSDRIAGLLILVVLIMFTTLATYLITIMLLKKR
jgi:hypothetical protein